MCMATPGYFWCTGSVYNAQRRILALSCPCMGKYRQWWCRYLLRVTVSRSYGTSVVKEFPFWIRNTEDVPPPPPGPQPPIKVLPHIKMYLIDAGPHTVYGLSHSLMHHNHLVSIPMRPCLGVCLLACAALQVIKLQCCLISLPQHS